MNIAQIPIWVTLIAQLMLRRLEYINITKKELFRLLGIRILYKLLFYVARNQRASNWTLSLHGDTGPPGVSLSSQLGSGDILKDFNNWFKTCFIS